MASGKQLFVLLQVLACIATSFQQPGPIKKMECPHPPFRTCLDYLKKGFDDCGIYRVFDNNGRPFNVYCDMRSESRSAWTLIESMGAKQRSTPPFRNTPFKVDAPVKENDFNWEGYRLSLHHMSSLKTNSTHWRATCSYPTYGVDYADYARGNFADFNIMTFLGSGICKKVEYINIRGHYCKSCTAKWWQVVNSYHLHVDSSSPGCNLDARKGVKGSEDNFGYYATANHKFRCTEDGTSTTQWWFGGYLD